MTGRRERGAPGWAAGAALVALALVVSSGAVTLPLSDAEEPTTVPPPATESTTVPTTTAPAPAPAGPPPSPPAGAEAAVGPAVTRTDGVDGRMNTYSSQVSGAHIWDMEVVGTTIYVAGKFTEVVEASGTWPRRDQPFLAAFDTRTGRWRSQWRPQVDRPAYALDVLPSGAIVAGGEFTRANGRPARGLVALDPQTGATDGRFIGQVGRPRAAHPAVVRDLEVRGNRLYAVGQFSRAVGGGPWLVVHKAARFNARTGAPDATWRPRIAGRSVYAVAVSTDGRRVHLGGEFSRVNGGRNTSQLATVSVRGAALLRGWRHGSNAPRLAAWPVGGVVFDLGVYRNSLYVAGAEHYWERRNSRTGRSIRFQRISNDAQSVDVVGQRIYIGCHCFHRAPRRQVWEIDARTGRPLPGRTGALQSGDGTWATAVAPDGCLWLGGDFNVATSVVGLGPGSYWVGRMARLCPPGGEAAGPGTEAAPGAEVAPGPVNPPWWQAPAAG